MDKIKDFFLLEVWTVIYARCVFQVPDMPSYQYKLPATCYHLQTTYLQTIYLCITIVNYQNKGLTLDP